jgi:hypothetical protein
MQLFFLSSTSKHHCALGISKIIKISLPNLDDMNFRS